MVNQNTGMVSDWSFIDNEQAVFKLQKAEGSSEH